MTAMIWNQVVYAGLVLILSLQQQSDIPIKSQISLWLLENCDGDKTLTALGGVRVVCNAFRM